MGYTNNAQIVWDSTTDANFQQWVQFIDNGFINSGWVHSSDTGQINPATVTHPVQNTYAGYIIYNPNDALASQFKIYVRIDFGSNNSATPGPAIKLTIGTGSNGAGTITGSNVVSISGTGTTPSTSCFTGSVSVAGTGATTYDSYASGDSGGRISFLLWRNAAVATTTMFGLERSLDANGNYTAAYYTVWTAGSGASSNGSQLWAVFPIGVTIGSYNMNVNPATNMGAFPLIQNNGSATTYTFGPTSVVYPVFPLIGRVDNPITSLIGIFSADQTEGAQFSATMYGTSHNYIFTKNGTATTMVAGLRSAIRYD